MPVFLLALGGLGVLWWLGRQQSAAPAPPQLPQQTSGLGDDVYYGRGPSFPAEIVGYGPHHVAASAAALLAPAPSALPNGQSDGGLASSAVLEALGIGANVATILMLVSGMPAYGAGYHTGAFGWHARSLPPAPVPPQVQGVVEWAQTGATSDQIASIMSRYPYPGVRAALTRRFYQLRSLGL